MSFRNYPNARALCICRESASELQGQLDRLQEQFDFVDLQFSTHYDSRLKQERFCVLLLVGPKGSIK